MNKFFVFFIFSICIFQGKTQSIAVLSNGNILSGSLDGSIRIWNPKNGTLIRNLTGHTARVSSVKELSNGNIMSASWDGTIRIWDPNNGSLIRNLDIYQYMSYYSLYAVEPYKKPITFAVELSKDTILSVHVDGMIMFWNLWRDFWNWNENQWKYTRPFPDIEKAMERRWIYNGRPVNSLAFLSNGNVATGSNDYTIRIFSLLLDRSFSEIKNLISHTNVVNSVIQLSNGVICSGSDDFTIKIWHPYDGTLIRTLTGHRRRVSSVFELSDGNIISSSNDMTIRIWNPINGTLIRTLQGHKAPVYSVVEIANGTILSGSEDGILNIWNPNNGTLIRTLKK